MVEREYVFSKDSYRISTVRWKMDWKSTSWNLFLRRWDYVWIACLVSPESRGGKWCVKAKLFSDNSWTNIQPGSWIRRLSYLEIIVFHKGKWTHYRKQTEPVLPLSFKASSSLYLSLEVHFGGFSSGRAIFSPLVSFNRLWRLTQDSETHPQTCTWGGESSFL